MDANQLYGCVMHFTAIISLEFKNSGFQFKLFFMPPTPSPPHPSKFMMNLVPSAKLLEKKKHTLKNTILYFTLSYKKINCAIHFFRKKNISYMF